MLPIAASVFHTQGLVDVGDNLTEVYDALGTYLGGHANLLFGVALLASGLSSSSVGTLAGQVVMQGFIGRQIPLFVRRGVTMLPALMIVAAGVDPTRALVLSQVVLSFGIPFALIPLLLFCRNRALMGSLVNRRSTTVAGGSRRDGDHNPQRLPPRGDVRRTERLGGFGVTSSVRTRRGSLSRFRQNATADVRGKENNAPGPLSCRRWPVRVARLRHASFL